MSPSSAEIPSTALPAALSRAPEHKREPAHSAQQPCTELPVAAYMPKLLTQLLAQDLSQNAKPDFLTWHHTGITTVGCTTLQWSVEERAKIYSCTTDQDLFPAKPAETPALQEFPSLDGSTRPTRLSSLMVCIKRALSFATQPPGQEKFNVWYRAGG